MASASDVKKRAKVAREIYESEKYYLGTLLDIKKLFITPLNEALSGDNKSSKPILDENQIRTIFSNIEDILHVNMELYHQLEQRIAHQDSSDPAALNQRCLGDIFCRIGPFLKIYSIFVKNYENSISLAFELERKNARFSSFLADRSAYCGGLSFEAYMLAPVQRIPRYKLLLEDMLKFTPDSHPDYVQLKQALKSINSVATFVNEHISEHDQTMKILELQKSIFGLDEAILQPGRKLIKQGKLTKICRKSNKTRAIFLFSDIIIYAALAKETPISAFNSSIFSTEKSRNLNPFAMGESFVFHRKISLDDIQVVDVRDSELVQCCFQIQTPEKSFALICQNFDDKYSWIRHIDQAVRAHASKKNSLRLNEDDQCTYMDELFQLCEQIAPVWIPDNATNFCMECGDIFRVFKRRHHCRSCGRLVCGACSPNKTRLPYQLRKANLMGSSKTLKSLKLVRVCKPCYDIIEARLSHLKADLLCANRRKQPVIEMHPPNKIEQANDTCSSLTKEQISYEDYSQHPPLLASTPDISASPIPSSYAQEVYGNDEQVNVIDYELDLYDLESEEDADNAEYKENSIWINEDDESNEFADYSDTETLADIGQPMESFSGLNKFQNLPQKIGRMISGGSRTTFELRTSCEIGGGVEYMGIMRSGKSRSESNSSSGGHRIFVTLGGLKRLSMKPRSQMAKFGRSLSSTKEVFSWKLNNISRRLSHRAEAPQ